MANLHDGDDYCEMHDLGINEIVFEEQRIGVCRLVNGTVNLSTYQKGREHNFLLSPKKARHLAKLLTMYSAPAQPATEHPRDAA